MKSTEVQTLGELCMRDTANWWAGLFILVVSRLRRVWHGLATVVDTTLESILAIRCDFLSPQGTQSAEQVAVSPVRLAFSLVYLSHLIHACAPLIDGFGHATWSGTVPVCRAWTLSFQKNRPFIFHALVALKRLVSDRHTHRPTTVTLAAHG